MNLGQEEIWIGGNVGTHPIFKTILFVFDSEGGRS